MLLKQQRMYSELQSLPDSEKEQREQSHRKGKPESLFGQIMRLHMKPGNGKQDGRFMAKARPREPHMTGVLESVPLSVDKWEPFKVLTNSAK